MINYLYDLFPNWIKNKVSWFIHEGKQHGLNDCYKEIIEKQYSLVLVPDAGSNNYEEHKILKENNIKCIVLDHHLADRVSEDAIIINNQLSNYPNKNLSGVGVVFQFCRYLDSILRTNYAFNYLDLVALGNTADVMSLKEIETKHLINKGFDSQNVKNPFIYYMWQKNKFKLGERITSWGAAFYIAPLVNAMVRSGTKEEKILLFESMLKFKAFEKILSNKKGHLLGETESLVEQAIRTCTNVKNRQTKEEKAGIEILEQIIKKEDMLKHKALIFLLPKNSFKDEIKGLIANKIANKYQRPCAVLTENENSYQGSARGYERTGVNDFKSICQNSSSCLYAEGHSNACGLGVKKDEANIFINFLDDYLKDKISNEVIYLVDYIYEDSNINPQNILDIANMGELWGKDIEESYVAVEGLKIYGDSIKLLSPDKNPTLKISLPNIDLLKFNSSEEEYNKLHREHGLVTINLIGRCNVNKWQGIITPQILIEDYEISEDSFYCF